MDTLGPNLLIGYDIGCSFSSTVASSSLGPRFKAMNNRLCVDAFHGYAHNFACQKKHHPNAIVGAGLEDLETMERIFSASNAVASLTRHATKYRRRVFIDEFFQQWDEDKYLNLALMLHNNYRQALKILQQEGTALEHAKEVLQLTNDDLDRFLAAEKEYVVQLQEPPEWNAHAVAYVTLLQKLREYT